MSPVGMDWFERLTGFRETSYGDTRSKLKIEGQRLYSLVNNRSYEVGKLELASLKELRDRVGVRQQSGRTKFGLVVGDVRKMHQENADALFQVASQFNLLEMTGPSVTPEGFAQALFISGEIFRQAHRLPRPTRGFGAPSVSRP
jgi:phosphoglycerate-specific signal transduction histidine kinase